MKGSRTSLRITFLAVAFTALVTAPALAQNAKTAGAAASSQLGYFPGNSWIDVPGMTSDIRVPSQEDLVFDVALQCNLTTDTTVKSKGGNKDTSTAEAGVKVRVRIESLDGDGNAVPGTAEYAMPNADILQDAGTGVTYCYRRQELSATLQGIIQNLACFVDDDANPDTAPVFDPDAEGCLLDPEEIQLVLSTLSAHAFNFFTYDLTSGDYRVTVEANPETATGAEQGSSNAIALVGLGSMVIDEVRFGNVPLN
jgi:hypothetical protein